MKDLFVLTADADALAFMTSLLERPEALGIRPISFACDRHPMKDAGIVKDGPEAARLRKREFAKALLLWDYHGSGHDTRNPLIGPPESENAIQHRLDGVSWESNSGAVVVVPELEEWLWKTRSSIETYFRVDETRLQEWIDDYAQKNRLTAEAVVGHSPKEVFEYLCISKLKQSISPADFAGIGRIASVRRPRRSSSFSKVADLLQDWFPL